MTLLIWSLRAAAVVLVGVLVALVLRRRSAATRSLVLRITLSVAWTLPLFVLFAPRLPVRLPEPAPAPAQKPRVAVPQEVPQRAPLGWSVEREVPTEPLSVRVVERTSFRTASFSPAALVLPLWGLGTFLLVLRWTVGIVRLRRLRRAAFPTDAPDVWRAAIGVPMTYARTILVPLESEGWPDPRVRAAILHERAHRDRGDWAWQTLAGLFAALHWPNPMAWLLVRLLRDAAEAAADDVAVGTMRPSDYARELLAVAALARPCGPALSMARRGGVKDRVAAVLADRDRRHPEWRLVTLIFTTLAIVALPITGVSLARNAKVKLEFVTDATGQYWDRKGNILPRGIRGAETLYPMVASVNRGERWAIVEMNLEGAAEGRGITINVARPARSHGYGPTNAEGEPFRLSITAPKGLSTTDLRVGVSEGAWQEIPHSGSFERTLRKNHVPGDRPHYNVEMLYPAAYGKQEIRMTVFHKGGRHAKLVGRGTSPGFTFGTVEGKPEEFESVRLEHRPYAWTTFRNVRLQPKVEETKPAAFGPVPLDGYAVRLAAVTETTTAPQKSWSPDGNPTTDPFLTPPSGMAFVGRGSRLFGFALDIQGPQLVEPSVRVGVELGSKSVVWGMPLGSPLDAETPDAVGRTLWPAVGFPADRRKTVTVVAELVIGPWRTEAGMRRGSRVGEITMRTSPTGLVRQRNGKRLVGVWLEPHGLPKLPKDRALSLRAYDVQGKPLETITDLLPGHTPDRAFVETPERVARWVLRSREIHRVRFEGVRLAPSP